MGLVFFLMLFASLTFLAGLFAAGMAWRMPVGKRRDRYVIVSVADFVVSLIILMGLNISGGW